MISVILYGRNDAHGYNLHRRAALSLNCIAEVLTDPDDELVFVDYNTPDELPTFVEAISDTLTQRCLGLLRVLRVPAAIHEQRFAPGTHLPAVEPVARNVAARRANASNRWLLSTNTDMILVPLQARSLSEMCGELPDGFYGLPRFELPEWLWERLPRSHPGRALADIERLGPALKLDELTLSHEWIRFDAPGDCQLILREDFLAVGGFNEQMLHGYHVDSNLSRRLLLHRGSIDSIGEHFAGYHCNHNRTRTVYHARRVENDLQRFFYSVEEAGLSEQHRTWGLADVTVEEVPISESVSADCAKTLIEAIPAGLRVPSDALESPFSLTYDSGHVVPFVADALFVSSHKAVIGYVGANEVLRPMLAAIVDGLGFDHPLAATDFDDMVAVEHICEVADVLIVDLGVDASQSDIFPEELRQEGLGQVPAALYDALDVLARMIELERTRCEQGKHPRPIVLVNSSAAFWEPFVLAQLDCSYTTPHSRVRRAIVKMAPDDAAVAIQQELANARRLMRWARRRRSGSECLVICAGAGVKVDELEEYDGFGTGWFFPEAGGIWTRGPRADLCIAIEGIGEGEYALTLVVGMVCVGPDEPLRVDLLANGERVDTREFTDSDAEFLWRVELPSHASAGGRTELTLLIDEPRSPLALGWSTDDRALGVHIRSVRVDEINRSVRLGETVVFSEGSEGARLLDDGWSTPEPTGVWTAAERARLAFRLIDVAPTGAEVVLDVAPFLTAEHRKLEVEVWAQGERVAAEVFRFGEAERALHVHLPTTVLHSQGEVVLGLHSRHPARPVDLGVNADPRRLGLHLRSFTIRTPPTGVRGNARVATFRKLRRQLGRALRA